MSEEDLQPLDGSDIEASTDAELARALETYLSAMERGLSVDLDRLAAEHPAIADELRSCLHILRLARRVEGEPGAGAAVEWMEDRPSASMLGDFRILRQIGRGGMGVVYEAEQVSLHRQVALKVLPFAAALDRHRLRRFQTEAQAAAQLHHTNIVPVFSVGCEQGVYYYAMQYIEGQSVAAVIRDLRQLSGLEPATGEGPRTGGSLAEEVASGRLTPSGLGGLRREETNGTHPAPRAPRPAEGTTLLAPHTPSDQTHGRAYFGNVANLGMQAAEALEHAHSLGIVHRDIKPANLLVDVRGNLWITDFGLALMQADTGQTLTGDVIGTLRYMSPEQALARRGVVDHRTDIYSLGITLYELVALRPAFGGLDREELFRQITLEEPRPLRRFNPAVPADLETIILKAMSKEPIERYATARELADDLRRFRELKPIKARRPTLWDRALKGARRHVAVVAAACLALLVTVGGMATGLLLIGRERDLASAKRKEALASAIEAQERAVDLNRQLYINRVNRAFGEWRENNVALAASLLEECPVNLRGWEWSYCWRLCHLDRLTLRRDGRPIQCLAFFPDGRRLIAASKEHSRDEAGPSEWTIWDAVTGRELETRPTRGTWVVAVAPSGTVVAVGSSAGPGAPGTVALWITTNDGPPRLAPEPTRVLGTKLPYPRGLAFSPDSRLIATASTDPDSVLELWEVESGRRQSTFPIENARVFALAFSPDGQQVAVACSDGSIRLRDVATEVWTGSLHGHTGTVYDVAYSPDGRRIITGSLDETVRVWDRSACSSIHVLRGHGSFVRAVATDPEGRRIASASEDSAVRLWDAATGKEIGILRGHAAFVSDVAFSRDGRRIASASEDGTVKLWDTTAVEPAQTISHPAWVSPLVFSPDGTTLATACRDGMVRIWDATSFRPILQHEEWCDAGTSLVISPDGRRIAWTKSGAVQIWGLATGRPPRTLGGQLGRPIGLAFNPDGRQLASTCWDGTVRLWDAETGTVARLFRGPWGIAFAAAYSPDGTRIGVAFTDGTIRIWCPADGREVGRLICENIEAIAALATNGVAFSPDGRWLAACSNTADRSPGEVRVFDLTTGQRVFTLRGHTSNVTSVAFSPDGRRIATSSFDRTVKLWETESGQEVFTLRGHTSGVLGVAFSPDGRRLATGSIDSTAKIWDTEPLPENLPVP
jgi:WD40 repeat protein/serine/threonine protein kinase